MIDKQTSQLSEFLLRDIAEVYGSRTQESKYPVNGTRTVVTLEQNKTRFGAMMCCLGGTFNEVDIAQIPKGLMGKRKFTVDAKGKVLLLGLGEKKAILKTYNEALFAADLFINDIYDGGNHDMDINELALWLTRKANNPFSPGLVKSFT